jgi:acyl-CoA hydrolase
MAPTTLIDALYEHYNELIDVEIIQIHAEGNAKYTKEPYTKAFRINSCFIAEVVRKALNTYKGSYIPIFLSEIQNLFRRDFLSLDVAFIRVSPDKHGYCSLGVSIDITLPAIQKAKKVIAQVNPQK